MNGTIVIFSLRMFPVYMNVLEAESGSSAKRNAACCAATYALTVLMFKSLMNSSVVKENVLVGELAVAAEA